MISRFALAAPLALALAACGSNEQPADTSTTSATTTETVAVPTDAPSAAPEALPSDAPSAAASATPSPTPSASASAKPTPTPSASAPAGPPQAFNQCTACHSTTPGKTLIGPSLAGVYGRKAGAVAGFQYSDALKNSGLTWNAGNLDAFIANPMGKVPGTMMGFAGVKDAAQRKAIVDYLKTL